MSEPYGSSSDRVLLPLEADHNKGIITDTESNKTLQNLAMPHGDQETHRRGHRSDRSPTRSPTTQKSHRSSKPTSTQMTRRVETQGDLRTRPPDQKPPSREEESRMFQAMKEMNLDVDEEGKKYVLGDVKLRNLIPKGAPETDPEKGPRRNFVKGVDVMKDTPETRKAARRQAEARKLEEERALLASSRATQSEASSRQRRSSTEKPYLPKATERRYPNTPSRPPSQSQRSSRPAPNQKPRYERSLSRSSPRRHAQRRSSYRDTSALERSDAPRDYSPPHEEDSNARRSSRSRHQQSVRTDRSYSRTRSRERVSRQPESEKLRKKSTRRYSKSRSPHRKKGARSQADDRTTKANDGLMGRGGEFGDSIKSYPPPPTNPFISGGMPSYGQYPSTQFSEPAHGQHPTPSFPTTAGPPTAAYDQRLPSARSRGSLPRTNYGNCPPPSPLNTAYYTKTPAPNPSYWYDEYGQIQYY